MISSGWLGFEPGINALRQTGDLRRRKEIQRGRRTQICEILEPCLLEVIWARSNPVLVLVQNPVIDPADTCHRSSHEFGRDVKFAPKIFINREP
jgi:hypothetical protein